MGKRHGLLKSSNGFAKQHNDRDNPVAANKLNIKTDAKCDLGSSHCYPAIVDPPDLLLIGVANESIATNLANTKNRDTARTEKIKR